MTHRGLVLALVAACGSQSEGTTTASTPTVRSGPSDVEPRAKREHREREEHKANVSRHRVLESAQQDALGATCEDLTRWAPQHCTPSCYPAEEKDPRAGTRLAGKVELQHHVCQRMVDNDRVGPWLIVEELDTNKPVARPKRGRAPKPHKKGSWQAEIVIALAEARVGKAPRGETFVVIGDAVRAVKHRVTREPLRCVTVAQYTTVRRTKLDTCGMSGKAACEASGNAAARGINLARFRIAEAAQLRDARKDDACRTAALDALATARGLPRWRQYAKLNIGAWTEGLAYKTRFDGVHDEDSLFALAAGLAAEAQQLLADCGMVGTPPTTPEHEHAFHSCPAPVPDTGPAHPTSSQ